MSKDKLQYRLLPTTFPKLANRVTPTLVFEPLLCPFCMSLDIAHHETDLTTWDLYGRCNACENWWVVRPKGDGSDE